MKVKVSFTLDVDVQAWAAEYGIDPAEVRADVRNHTEQGVRDQLGGLGLLNEDG